MTATMIMGASYGSLLAIKLLLAGHDAKLVCLPDEAALINDEGQLVRMPAKGRDGLVEVHSSRLPGTLSAATPADVDPADYDLIVLAMQEPQYRAPGVRELLDRVAASRKPVMSIMNMPPLAYVRRIPGIDTGALEGCYTDASVWDGFEPPHITLCSPDPQAFRPPDEKTNVLQVSLPTNFKAARFDSEESTDLLRGLQADIEAATFDDGKGEIALPVKLKVHDSIFVPLAKWAMLLTGNYRCVGKDGMRPIREAVHSDLALSESVYDWVCEVCEALGAAEDDLVPFEKYAAAADGLIRPSSAARALDAGAVNIERADRLVQALAAQKGMRNDTVDETVARVDAWLEGNRRKA
ncbi:MAG: hypothetical protein OYH76_05390 [Defluviicoccus sp.]|nr:hypothetical protein [Defluviicoccus sp.]MDE0275309.1 hypothetical protein [Defluviicoccus sp.]